MSPGAMQSAAPNTGRLRLTLPPPPSAEEREAAAAFERGKAAVEKDPYGALEALMTATRLVPKPEYVLYAAWARYLLTDEEEREAARRSLERATRLCVRDDPTLAFAYYVIGHLYLARGERASAELAFLRSQSLDPAHLPTQRELSALRADA